MATFYKKDENGEFIEADDQVDLLFREKSDKIVSAKLSGMREKESARIREEIEADVRKTTSENIKKELQDEISKEYQVKLDQAETENRRLDTLLRRKTIAAEYGFKPGTEQFLGEGSDDEMRAKADILRSEFQTSREITAPEKKTIDDSAMSSFVKMTDE